ncbi:uncharacterized protein CELE_ZK662.5 [Caenorhabditis elegans]|uniref:Uncharacterized protein n=1 Tax=Caenorhabditis elegans TaxID=6239 RepID=Q9U1N7_CAEEL|nr:Uncharacterized protein CELE_ZK662.5 [Caenorhabditis elegans]CAB60456.2 Uncharacterized protein CELE_ZK662.5 [Caenorhabditis elegans]
MHYLKRVHYESNPATDLTSNSATNTTAVVRKTSELIARFFASQGIALECAQESLFQELIKHISPNCMVPKTYDLAKAMDKICSALKPLVNYEKIVGPLSATIDITGENDQKYMAFSIHYFEDLYERKSAIYLRKLVFGTINPENILCMLRRAVNSYSFSNVRFSNLVCSNQNVYNVFATNGLVKRYNICFYSYITNFVANLLEIEEFSNGLTKLRAFVRLIRNNSDWYARYRRMQLQHNGEMDVPSIDEEGWNSTAIFLAQCLALHDRFIKFCDRIEQPTYISDETFNHLIYLQRLLQKCMDHCQELSAPNNSISQVVPAIKSIRNFIESNSIGYQFQETIREMFTAAFGETESGEFQLRYDLATFLDPHYAYCDSIHTQEMWRTLENTVALELVQTDL